MRKYLTCVIVVLACLSVKAQITWQKKNGPYGGTISTTEISSSGNIYVLTENTDRIYKSTDNGINWTLIDIPGLEENEDINDIKVGFGETVYAVTGFANFYASDDAGVTWNKLNTGTDSSDGGFDNANQIALNPVTGELLLLGYAGPNPVVYISNDGGFNWIVGATLVQGPDDIVVADAGPSGMIFVYSCCGVGKVFASDDGGFSFNEFMAGVSDVSIQDMAISPNGFDAFLLTRDRIYQWDIFDLDITADWLDISENLPAFFTNNSALCTATSGAANYLFFGDSQNKVLYRKDLAGLNNWTTQNTAFAVNGSEAYDLDAKNQNLIFVSARSIGFFRSTNAGSTWIDSNKGIENQRFNDMVFSDDESRLIVAAEQHVYSTTDQGQNWTRFDLTGGTFNTINSFLRLSNGNLYGYGSVSKFSNDDGSSWSDVGSPFPPPNFVLKVVNSDDNRFFALNNNFNQIAYSANAGTTWTAPIPLTISLTDYFIENIFVDASHNMFALIRDYDTGGWDKLYKITFSPNPGVGTPTTATATQITTATPGFTIVNNNLEEVTFRNGKLYAIGRNSSGDWRLCISSDGGATFTSKNLTDGGYRFFVTSNDYILVARSDNNDNHSLSLSRDAGNTFITTNVGNAYKGFIRSVEMDADGVAYALMENLGLFKTLGTIILPEPPINLTTVGRGATGLTIRFEDNSLTEEGFVVEREINSVYDTIYDTGDSFGTGDKRYFQDRFLLPSTTYNYRISSHNDAGGSATVPISVTTLAQTAPSILDNRSWTGETQNIDGLAAPATNTTVGIKHLGNGRYSVSDITAGILAAPPVSEDPEISAFFYETNGETYLEPTDGPIREQQNGTWNPGTNEITLFWRLEHSSGPDKFEQITYTLNPSDPIPAAPSNVQAYVYSNTSIEVSWTGTFFEEEFIIERSTASGGPFAEAGRIDYPNTRFVDDGTILPLSPGSTYFYRVLGSNSNGNSPPSPVSTGVTLTSPKFVVSNSVVSTASAGNATGFIWGDYDNDGDEDAIVVQLTFFTGSETTPFAFRNDGGGVFTAVTGTTGLQSARYIIGAAADYDNDGSIDIYLTTTSAENLLYRGNGNFTFTKVDPNPVGANSNDFEQAAISASWMDVDKNGRLDLFVAGQGDSRYLYTQSVSGTFTPVTTEDLVTYAGSSDGHSWSDYDNDGDMDIFVIDNAQQTTPNRLYKNNGDGTFTRVTGLVFDTDLDFSGFSTSWADYDSDGDMDLFMGVQSDSGPTSGANVIYRNSGSPNYTFTRITAAPVTDAKAYQTFGTAWGDIDNDGDLDLLTGNNNFDGGGGSPNGIFLNNGSGVFTQVTNEKFNDATLSNFGISFADYDKDGFLDIAAASVDPFSLQLGTPGVNSLLFKNNHTPNSSRSWCEVKLEGNISNRLGIGARITVVAGGKTQIREITTTSGFATGGSLIAHFGLGSATTINSITVKWPSGVTQTLTSQAINTILTIVEDGTGPIVINRLPLNGAPAASTALPLGIELNEVSTAVAAKNLYVYLASDLSTPVYTIAATSAIQTGNRFEFFLPAKLLPNTDYVVDIDAGAFEDVFGNDFAGLTSWTFHTSNGPQITSRVPASSATGVFANTTLAITFNEPVTGQVSKNIKIFKSSDLVTPTATLAATAGSISGNTVSFTLPSKLERLTLYNVSIDAAAFVSVADGNDFAGLTAANWVFTTDEGPTVTTTAPAHNSTNTAINAALEITFNRNIIAVGGKKIKVLNGVATVLDLEVSSNGTIATNKYTLPAPSGNWPFNTSLAVTVDPGAFVDVDQNDFVGIAAGTWTFVTAEAPDITAPVFGTFDPTPFNALEKSFSQFNMGVSVTDNKQVATVVMKHRKINQKDFTSSPMTLNVANSKYETAVTFTGFSDDMGFEYYFEATDNAGTPNTTRLPAGITYFKTKISHTGSNAPTFSIAAGGTKQTWQVISIPFILTNNQISTVFAQLGEVDNTKWRMIHYTETPTPDWLEYPTSFTTIERGKGYFVNTRTAATINLANATVADNTRDDLFTINLVKGWNQVGNPYNVPINWSDVIAYNNASTNIGTLKMYVSGSYGNGNTLQPFQGGFVFLQNAVTGVKIPFQGQSTPGGGRKGFEDLGPDINQEEWALPLKLTSGEISYELGSVGMALDAEAGFDQYDDITPPRFFEYLEMNFSHPEHFAKRFTRDVVRSQSAYTWEFTADSNLDGQAEINWDNSQFSGGYKDLYLLDISRQKLINMKEVGSYSFNTKESVNFRVYFGENLRIAPDKVHLGKAYPNPTSGTTLMAFSLPESGGMNQLVTLDIFDAMGRSMGTISQGRFNPGYHEVSWNAKELNNGFYTYRLTVQGKQGRTTQVNKLIIK